MYIVNEEILDADQNQANVRKLAAVIFRNLVLKNIQVSARYEEFIFAIVRRQYRYI